MFSSSSFPFYRLVSPFLLSSLFPFSLLLLFFFTPYCPQVSFSPLSLFSFSLLRFFFITPYCPQAWSGKQAMDNLDLRGSFVASLFFHIRGLWFTTEEEILSHWKQDGLRFSTRTLHPCFYIKNYFWHHILVIYEKLKYYIIHSKLAKYHFFRWIKIF